MAYLEELLPEFRKGAKIRYCNWKKGEYICIKNDKVVDEKGNYLNAYCGYLKSDNWEFYKEPEPDWDYIIKNKCLCWFWNNKEKNKVIGILYKTTDDYGFKFVRENTREGFLNCRPVRRDEIVFYEEE